MVNSKKASSVILPIMLFALCFPLRVTSREIKEVKILHSGITHNPDIRIQQECKKFKPTIQQIKRFFNKAYPVPRSFGAHDRYSPCYADGTIIFEKFGMVTWSITSGGVGTISWDKDEQVDVFYRNNGWYDPTACTYGLGDKGHC